MQKKIESPNGEAMTTPKLKPGAEEFIQRELLARYDSPWRQAHALEILHWTLANLPKLLEATNKIWCNEVFDADFEEGNLAVAIIEVEENAKQELKK